MAALQRNLTQRSVEWSNLCNIVCVLPRLLHASGALLPPSKHSRGLIYAMFRSDLLVCYASVLAAITHVPHWELNDCTIMCRLLSVVLVQISHVAGGRPTEPASDVAAVAVANMPFAPAVYREWIKVLSKSKVLETAARALLHLEASARAALEQGNCSVHVVRDQLSTFSFHLGGIVNCVMDPHLSSPILSLSPRPLATPGDASPGIRSTLKQLRELLSGTCIQFWLGKHLLEARLMLTEGVGALHGLPPAVLLPAPLSPAYGFAPTDLAPHLQLTINMCATVWQITVSGPRPPTPQIALGRDMAPDSSTVLLAPSMPYSAVSVYDMTAEAVWCVTQRLEELERIGRANHNTLGNTLRLLIRLVSELEPDDAAQRLPLLWRSVTHLAPVLISFGASSGQSKSVCRMIMTLLQALMPSERGTLGERQLAAGAAAAHAGDGDPWVCTRSLSCALKARFLPALEHTFRRLASQQPPAGSQCVAVLNVVLRVSGVWPAVLAHGSAKEVASLIATLGKVARALRDQSQPTHRTTGGSPGSSLLTTGGAGSVAGSASDVAHQFTLQLLALMEQAAAVVLQPWNLPPPPTPPTPGRAGGKGGKSGSGVSSSRKQKGRAAAGGSGGIAGSGGAAGAAALAAAKRKLLELNNSFDPCKANHITLEWLVFTGGQPPLGARPSEQQRTMAVFALLQWLPSVASLLTSPGVGVQSWWTAELGRVVSRVSLLAALQCLQAREAVAEASALALPAANLVGAAAEEPLGPNSPHHARHLSWRDVLLNRLGVMAWLARVFSLPDRVIRDYPDLVPGALDVLEVLAVALPYDVVRHVTLVAGAGAVGGAPSPSSSSSKKAAAAAAATKDRGGGKSAGSSTPAASVGVGFEIVSSGTVMVSEAFLLRYGRTSLRAALQELHVAVLDETAAILRGGSGRVGEALSTVSELVQLRSELGPKHELERLPPPLPPPSEAERVAASLGVKRCGNARCSALDGAPQESEVVWKRCSRCKAVNYCCLGCQREHWETGHRRECGSGGAATASG